MMTDEERLRFVSEDLRSELARQQRAAAELAKVLDHMHLDLTLTIRCLRLHGEEQMAQRMEGWAVKLLRVRP